MVLRRSPLARIMAQIRLFYRKKHYRDHLMPIWEALPDPFKMGGELDRFDRLLVAGGPDVLNGHPYIYVEHGAGQSYIDAPPNRGYAGSDFHEDCELFICPNEEVAQKWNTRYPNTPTAVVGCPKLDVWHSPTAPPPPKKTVAITFHWDLELVPETRSAFPAYRHALPEMVSRYRKQGWVVLGHSHPRYETVLVPYWRSIGVEYTDNPLRDASVLIADNTSMMAEFMSCGRPVLGLNAPWYRRDVVHGQRFWSWQIPLVDTPEEAVRVKLKDLPVAPSHPYAYADGQASRRAAEAIVRVLSHSQR